MTPLKNICLLFVFILGLNNIYATEQQEVSDQLIKIQQLNNKGELEETIKLSFQTLTTSNELSFQDSIKIFNILANKLYQLGDFNAALKYAEQADLIKNDTTMSPTKYKWLMKFYNGAEAYDKSILHMKKTVVYYEKNTVEDVNVLARAYNDIGFTFYLNDQPDSAEHYYLKVLELDSLREKSSAMFGLATGNLGNLYHEKGDYKRAIEHLKIDIQLTKGAIWNSYNNALLGLAECYAGIGDYSKAANQLKVLLAQERHEAKNLKGAYHQMAKIYDAQGKHNLSGVWLKKYVQISDSMSFHETPKKDLVNKLAQSRIDLIQKDLELTENQLKLKENDLLIAENEQREQSLKNRIYFISGIAFLLVLIITLVFLIQRQKKNSAIVKLENDLLESELKNKQNDLRNFGTNLTYKNKFIDEIDAKLKEVQKESPEEIKKRIFRLSQEFKSYKLTDNNITAIQSDIDKVNSFFYEKLETKFPSLTQNEKELCGLLVLKVSTKDIATLRNVSSNAIKKARQRLRKKLNLTEDEDLVKFLEGA
jgi:DNA-binding CsgD family transcriptional regulator